MPWAIATACREAYFVEPRPVTQRGAALIWSSCEQEGSAAAGLLLDEWSIARASLLPILSLHVRKGEGVKAANAPHQ